MKHLIFSLFTFVFLTQSSWATILPIHGVLRDSDNRAVPDGPYSMTFKVYNAAENGTLLETISNQQVEVVGGVYFAEVPITVPFNQELWVGISVNGGTELSPRVKLIPSIINGTVQGDLTVSGNATISGTLNSGAITSTGSISGSSISSSGDISGSSISSSGSISGSSISSSGDISSTSGKIVAPRIDINGVGLDLDSDNRLIRVLNSSSSERVKMDLYSDVGRVSVYGSNGNLNARMTYDSNTSEGYIAAYNSSGYARANMFVEDDIGKIRTYGPNGSMNCNLSYSDDPNDGYIAVYDDNGYLQIRLYVQEDYVPVDNIYVDHGYVEADFIEGIVVSGSRISGGTIEADVVNSVMPNPNNPAEEIFYAGVQSPEPQLSLSGTATLVNGRATINLPDHFTSVATDADMTVHLTPRSAESKGLAAIHSSLQGIEVVELMNGKGNYDFYWEVKCKRAGQENYQTIRPAREAFVPMDERDRTADERAENRQN